MGLVFKEPEDVGASFANAIAKQKVTKRIVRDRDGLPVAVEEVRELAAGPRKEA